MQWLPSGYALVETKNKESEAAGAAAVAEVTEAAAAVAKATAAVAAVVAAGNNKNNNKKNNKKNNKNNNEIVAGGKLCGPSLAAQLNILFNKHPLRRLQRRDQITFIFESGLNEVDIAQWERVFLDALMLQLDCEADSYAQPKFKACKDSTQSVGFDTKLTSLSDKSCTKKTRVSATHEHVAGTVQVNSPHRYYVWLARLEDA